jgi:hypothetical protein
MKKNNKQKNYFIFELLFFVLVFVIIGLLIQQNYKMTQKQKQDTFVVIEKSKKKEMNRCEYKLQNSQGKIIIYNEEFDSFDLNVTLETKIKLISIGRDTIIEHVNKSQKLINLICINVINDIINHIIF